MVRPLQVLIILFVAALLVMPSIVPTVSAQTATCSQTYVVQAGDWLSTIAQKFLGDAKTYTAIVEATNQAAKTDTSFAAIADPNKIEVGQKLCIPATTAVPGRELAGIYTTVGPAADASALVETLVLGGDGQVRYTLDYIGKASIDAKGTWKQEGDTVTVSLYEQAGKAVQQTMAFTVKDGNLVAKDPPNATYAKTAPNVAFYTGLYTANRASADGSEKLIALALLPNGDAQLTSSSASNPFILQTGTWQIAPNPDTNTDAVTVKLTKQGDQTIDETYVFQAGETALRGTQYNADKWGTDLTFTKYNAPAEPETPATAQLAAITGSYSAQLPAADAIGRVIVLDLTPKNDATMTTQLIGKGEPIVETGAWAMDAGNVVVTLDTKSGGKQTLTFAFQDGALVLQDPVGAGYGSDGLTLQRAGSGKINNADFGGVTFTFDQQLAQSAQGETLPAVPVTEGPALGGASPAAVRFLFNGDKAPDYFATNLPMVLVYKADDWNKLDPATAKTVEDLKTLLKDKPAEFPAQLPLVPPANAQQVFHAQTKYLDFQNGTGVGFVTYYAQGVSPVTSDLIFYTFQGLTNDGKYYVTAFFPVTTALLPKDPNAALGGKSYDEWAKDYMTYLAALVKDLNGLVPAAYTPNLTLIEGMVQSIAVSDTTLQ